MTKWNIGWGITSKCNMNCAFCYSKNNRTKSIDLKLNDWINFIDDNNKYINSINYGTGENTLLDDWFTFIGYVREKYPDIRQSLTTNGHLSLSVKNELNFEIFKKAIDEVDVSLDFANKEKHNEFRGQPLAYKWAIDTLKLCFELKKQCTIVFLGSEVNVSHDNLDSLFGIAKEYNAILRMNIFRPTEGLNEKSLKFILSRDKLLDIIYYIDSNYSILSIGDAYLSPYLLKTTRNDPSGNKSLRILSNGDITPSTYLINDEYILGNIKEDSILESISKSGKLLSIVKNIIPDECEKCIYKDMCQGGVLDRRYLWYGSLNKKDPYCHGPYFKENEKLVHLSNEKFSSVHDDYLPTIFFSPKNNSFSDY